MEYYPKIIKRWLTKSSIYLSYDGINKTSNRRRTNYESNLYFLNWNNW